MRKLIFLFLFSFAVPAWATNYFGDFTADSVCTEDTGDWVFVYDGNASIIYAGTFGSGTATVYTRLQDRITEIAVTGSSFSIAKTFPVGLGGGGELCVALVDSTDPVFHWEINPALVKDPNSGNLIPRYFSEEYD